MSTFKRLSPVDFQRCATLFVGYRRQKPGDEFEPTYLELIGLQTRFSDQDGRDRQRRELFRSILIITKVPDGSSDWQVRDVAVVPVAMAPSGLRQDLSVELANGRVQRVLWNGKEIVGLATAPLDTPSPKTNTRGIWGVFTRDGTTKFYNTHVIGEDQSRYRPGR